MIWTMVVIAAALAFPLPGALLLIDGTRKKCPSCGRLWARTLANTSYTKLVPTNEYLNWKVFFDNHIVGFAPEAAIPRPGSPKVIQVYTCRYCREPFSKLPGDAQPRLSLVLKLGVILFTAFLADLAASIASSVLAPGGNILLEIFALLLAGLSIILVSAGLALQFVGKEFD